ncbi:MAG TPA: type II secretion system minor pseudopilin GspI [Spongiibacteraceae bacterium]|nr:type II secretion system minor pseudopilin GspI [Spongiibacteraceae bacterium]
MKRRQGGFTLLEVLVALTILAVTALAVARQVGGSVGHLQRLEHKTLALSLAENELSRVRDTAGWPSPGAFSRTVTFMEQRWLVATEVNATSDPDLRRITVQITADTGLSDKAPLVSISAFRGRH